MRIPILKFIPFCTVLFALRAEGQANLPACDSVVNSNDFDLHSLRPTGEEGSRKWIETCYRNGQMTISARKGRVSYVVQPLASYTLMTRTDTTTMRKSKHLYDTILVAPHTIFYRHQLVTPAGKNLLTKVYWLRIDTSTLKARMVTAQVPGDMSVTDFLPEVLEGKSENGWKDWKEEKTVQLIKTKDGYYYEDESLLDLLLSDFILLEKRKSTIFDR